MVVYVSVYSKTLKGPQISKEQVKQFEVESNKIWKERFRVHITFQIIVHIILLVFYIYSKLIS